MARLFAGLALLAASCDAVENTSILLALGRVEAARPVGDALAALTRLAATSKFALLGLACAGLGALAWRARVPLVARLVASAAGAAPAVGGTDRSRRSFGCSGSRRVVGWDGAMADNPTSERARRAAAPRSWRAEMKRLADLPEIERVAGDPAELIGLVRELTRAAWAMRGAPLPDYSRAEMPGRVLRADDGQAA